MFLPVHADPAATAQLIALLHRIPPPRITDIDTSRGVISSSSGYQAVPRRSSGDVSHSTSQDRLENIDDDQEEELVKNTQQPVSVFEDPVTQEEMGKLGWWVLGWSFAASATITVSPRTQRSGMLLTSGTLRYSLRAFCSRSYSRCRFLTSSAQSSAQVLRQLGPGGE